MSVGSAANQMRHDFAPSNVRKLGRPITHLAPTPPATHAEDPRRVRAPQPRRGLEEVELNRLASLPNLQLDRTLARLYLHFHELRRLRSSQWRLPSEQLTALTICSRADRNVRPYRDPATRLIRHQKSGRLLRSRPAVDQHQREFLEGELHLTLHDSVAGFEVGITKCLPTVSQEFALVVERQAQARIAASIKRPNRVVQEVVA